MSLIQFYTNKQPANGKDNYMYKDIVKRWTDYDLEVKHDYIQWLFPDKTGGTNPKAPKLTKEDIKIFSTNANIRKHVIRATLRMLLFLGFYINPENWAIEIVKNPDRKVNGIHIGLYAPHNYKRLTRIMLFLNKIEMEQLSALVFLALCKSLENPQISMMVHKHNSFIIWLNTQPFLARYRLTYNHKQMKILDKELASTLKKFQTSSKDSLDDALVVVKPRKKDIDVVGPLEKLSITEPVKVPSPIATPTVSAVSPKRTTSIEPGEIEIVLSEDEDIDSGSLEPGSEKKSPEVEYGGWREGDEETPFALACSSIRGLDYTGNSCYQDSTLLALFALKNSFIDREILSKDIQTIVNNPKKDIVCSKNAKDDFKIRQDIQDELVRITGSMRGLDHVKSCSQLRTIFSRCKGSQEFHKTRTQDAGEFLLYLFNIFQVEGRSFTRDTYITNDLTKYPELVKIRQVSGITSPMLPIDGMSLEGKDKVNLRDYILQREDADLSTSPYRYEVTNEYFIRRIEVTKTIATDYLVFNVQRNYINNRGKEVRNSTEIIPPEEIKVGKITLHLHAIIVHVPAHYTCYIRCGKTWFYYDDNPSGREHKILPLGTYEKMLTKSPNPLKNGTLYFYT